MIQYAFLLIINRERHLHMFQGTFLLLANNIHIALLQAKNSAICLKIFFFIVYSISNVEYGDHESQ